MHFDTNYYRNQIDEHYDFPVYPTTDEEWDKIERLQRSVRRHSKTAMDELLCIFHPLFVSTAKSLTGERTTLNFITSKLKSIYDGYANLRMAYEDKNFIDVYICIVIGFINATNKFKQENKEYTYKLFILNNLHFYIHTELRKYITDFYKKTNYISFYQLRVNDIIDRNQEIQLSNSEQINYTDNYFPLKLKHHSNLVENENLDIDWINGVTCNTPFDILTIREREILVMLYIEDMSSIEIAKHYNITSRMVRIIKTQIKEKLRRVLQ